MREISLIKDEVLQYFRKKYFRDSKKYHLPQVGVYYPSTLVQRCLKDQWNFYNITARTGQLPDDMVLRISEGHVWHEILESLDCFEAVEVPVIKEVKLAAGDSVTIRGRADAVSHNCVWEFKRVRDIPNNKFGAKYEHELQANWYAYCLNKPKYVIVYVGYRSMDPDKSYGYYSPSEFTFKEYHRTLHDGKAQTMVGKAEMLHRALTTTTMMPTCTCPSHVHDRVYTNFLLMLEKEKTAAARIRKMVAKERGRKK